MSGNTDQSQKHRGVKYEAEPGKHKNGEGQFRCDYEFLSTVIRNGC